MYDINEDAVCFGIFKANDYVIYATNAKNSASALGVNKLTDLRQDEFAASYTGFKPVSRWSGLPRLSTHEYNRVPLVSSVDWTKQGVITPVKNQGQCSSCWSFSTTGALEGAWALSTGNLDLWTRSRAGAPVAQLDAPTDDTYTFEVDCRLVLVSLRWS